MVELKQKFGCPSGRHSRESGCATEILSAPARRAGDFARPDVLLQTDFSTALQLFSSLSSTTFLTVPVYCSYLVLGLGAWSTFS